MDSVLSLDGITVDFGGVRAVSGVTFDYPPEHDIIGIIGANGAGKSTLLSVIAGDVQPTGGRMRVLGRPVTRWDAKTACRMGVGRTFQIPRPFRNLTVLDNLVVSGLTTFSLRDAKQRAEEILDKVHLTDVAYNLPDELNLASRKRLEVGKAMMTQPKLLLLDEIFEGTSEYDIVSLIELMRQVAADGVKLIVVEHVIRAVKELCPWLFVLDQGELLTSGPTQEVLESQAVIDAYLGEAAIV